jgi:hypothetical protein
MSCALSSNSLVSDLSRHNLCFLIMSVQVAIPWPSHGSSYLKQAVFTYQPNWPNEIVNHPDLPVGALRAMGKETTIVRAEATGVDLVRTALLHLSHTLSSKNIICPGSALLHTKRGIVLRHSQPGSVFCLGLHFVTPIRE